MTEEEKLGSGHYEQRFLNFISNIKFYKFPLVVAGMGGFLLLLSIILLINNYSGQEVIFSQEASGSGTKDNKIRVDIEGAVKMPGIYNMGENSRIVDALTAAGGLSENADRGWIAKSLNQAAKLVDGGKIYIPSLEESSDGKISNRAPSGRFQISNINKNQNKQTDNLLGVTTGLVNINSANQAELEALPGVGPITAGKIISNRPYQTLEELTGRKVVGKALFEKIKNLISI